MHTSLGGHTVDDIKGIVVVQGSDTTDTDSSSTRGITVGCDVHAWHTTLQSFHWVVFILLCHLVNAYRRNGTSQIGLALGGIASNHHLLQHFGIIFHRNLHVLLCRHFRCLVTDVGKNEDGALFDFDCEVTVEVGDCTVRGSLLHHCGTDNRFAFCVNDGTFDLRLRVHDRTDRQENKTQKKFF